MAAMNGPVRVLLVDDDALVRSALELLLAGDDAIEVVGAVTDGDEVPTAIRTHTPDVILMDIRMLRVDGITATARLQRQADPPPVIVLTTFDGDDEVLQALRAGACGYLLKDTPPAQIVAAIHTAARGEPILSPRITRRLMERTAGDVRERDRAREAMARLSDREREVAREIAAGLPNPEIAANLHMSVATVKAHITHIFAKLDLTNRTQIALLAHDADRRST